MTDEFDDIFGDVVSGDDVQSDPEIIPPPKDDEKDNVIVSDMKSNNNLSVVNDVDDPKILSDLPLPEEYKSLEKRIRERYLLLPKIDYDNIYKELGDLSIKSCPTPTLQVLNVEIQKVQAAKDRLSEIFVEVMQCYTFKKRAVDILRDGWARFADDKSADRRKADAIFKTSLFEIDFALIESLLKACTHILKNLDSLHDSLSRRITVIQLQLKLHDMGRGALPDIRFDNQLDNQYDLSEDNEKKDIDPNEGINAREESF